MEKFIKKSWNFVTYYFQASMSENSHLQSKYFNTMPAMADSTVHHGILGYEDSLFPADDMFGQSKVGLSEGDSEDFEERVEASGHYAIDDPGDRLEASGFNINDVKVDKKLLSNVVFWLLSEQLYSTMVYKCKYQYLA